MSQLTGIVWQRDAGVAELIDHLDEKKDSCWDDERKMYRIDFLHRKELKLVIAEINKCQNDFIYAARNYFWIVNKRGADVPFRLWESQELVLDRWMEIKKQGRAQKLIICKARRLGMCLSPETKVLTSDLRWVTLDDIQVGQEVVSVDERGIGRSPRKMRKAVVLSKNEVCEPAYRLTMENGEELIATSGHRFLCKRRGSCEPMWREVNKATVKYNKSLINKSNHKIFPGDEIRYFAKPWEFNPDYEDGWVSGMMDGEGSMPGENSSGTEVNISQSPGPVFERVRRYLAVRGYNYRIESKAPKPPRKGLLKAVVSRTDEVFRIIGKTRPTRFIGRTDWWEGKEPVGKTTGGAWCKVVKVEELPAQRMIDLQTSTKTFIANGFVSHNSTLIEGLIAWRTMLFPNQVGMVISYKSVHSETLFAIMAHIYEMMPWWLKPMASSITLKDGLIFDNPNRDWKDKYPGLNSRVIVQAATQVTATGQGYRLSAVHICLAPETPIITSDGEVKRIVDVQPGDYVLTSSGRMKSVRAVHKSERRNEITADLWLWGQFSPLSVTQDHPVLTPEGPRPAGDLCAGDFVRMPVRKISDEVKDFSIDIYKTGGKSKNRKSMSRNHTLPCSSEWGYFFGLYLAEGSVHHNNRLCEDMRADSIHFGIHREEEEKVKGRLQAALGEDYNLSKYRHNNSLTSVYRIHGAGIARFVEREFGAKDDKTVPDWAWSAGTEFCKGILFGYLDGDASFKGRAVIPASSIRLSIPIQMRSLAASLGYGWASIDFRGGGQHYGRNCKDIWTWRLSGEAADRLAVDMGRGSIGGKEQPHHWRYSEDGKNIDIEIQAAGQGFASEVYDLEVDAPEHDFCTIHCNVKNSEFADFEDDKCKEIIEEDVDKAIEDEPENFGFLESTGKGSGRYAHMLWRQCVSLGDRAKWTPVFLPWFFEKNRKLFPMPVEWKLQEPERLMRERVQREWVRCTNPDCGRWIESILNNADNRGDLCGACMLGTLQPYKLQDDQLAWMWRERINAAFDADSKKKLRQELASTAEECWQLTGYPVFSESDMAWVNSTLDSHPLYEGFMDDKGSFHAWDRQAKHCYTQWCTEDHEFNDKPLKIWELPRPGATYVLGGDVSEGLGGKSDFSVGWLNRVNRWPSPDFHVATYRSNEIDPVSLAAVFNFLGRWYNEAMMSVEVNKYDSCFQFIRYHYQYPNLFRWKHLDSTNPLSNKWGWWTQQTTKPRLWQTARKWFKDRMWVIRDPEFYEEMKTFQKLDPEDRGASSESNAHDDVCMSGMIALYTSHELDWDENNSNIPLCLPGREDGARRWTMECTRCGRKWQSDTPSEEICPNDLCGCKLLRGTMNAAQQLEVKLDWEKEMLKEGDGMSDRDYTYDAL